MRSRFPVSGDAVFRALIDSAPAGPVVVNREGRTVLVNLRTEDSCGQVRAELFRWPIKIAEAQKFAISSADCPFLRGGSDRKEHQS